MSGISGSGNIVTDGLVLHLDAANPKSYVSGSTTWNDLSGNRNNGTLVNGVGYNASNAGSLVFDGVNDCVDLGDILNEQSLLTISFFVKNINNGVILTEGYRTFETRIDAINISGYIGTTGVNNWYSIGESSNSIQHNADVTKWNYFTYVLDYNTDNVKLYCNSILKTSFTIADIHHNYPTYNYNLTIGKRIESNNAFFSGEIGVLTLHNRLLTQQEITQNYNTLKNRYI